MQLPKIIELPQNLIDEYRNDLKAGVCLGLESEKALYNSHLQGLSELENLFKSNPSVEDLASLLRTERRRHGWSYLSGEVGGHATTSADRLYRYLESQIFDIKGRNWYYSNDHRHQGI